MKSHQSSVFADGFASTTGDLVEKKDIVLIDDDPSFGLSVIYAARRAGLSIDYFTNLLEMGSIARFEAYEVAIVDYHLEQMSGLEVAEYFPIFFQNIPIVLVSSKKVQDLVAPTEWPTSIKLFVNKELGAQAIIAAVEKLSIFKNLDETRPVLPVISDTDLHSAQHSVDAGRSLTAVLQELVESCHACLASLDFVGMEQVAQRLSQRARQAELWPLTLLAGSLRVHAHHRNLSVCYAAIKELDTWHVSHQAWQGPAHPEATATAP